jgi:nucleoside-diphosphate-sugar epimerase
MRACASRGLAAVGLVRECELDRLPAAAVSRIVDWTVPDSLSHALADVAPALVVHCAGAAARVGETAKALYVANVLLTRRLLESVSESSALAGVVILSSAAVYGPAAPTPTSEESPLAPAGDYAASKVEAESVARHFARVAGLRVSIARPFNVVGRGEPPGSVVEVIASQVLAAPRGSRTTVRLRECRSIRDYVDVDDVASALLTLARRGEPGEAYNVCSGIGVSVAELVDRAARAWCRQVAIATTQPDAPATISIGVWDRIATLGWAPMRTLDETLARMGDLAGSSD